MRIDDKLNRRLEEEKTMELKVGDKVKVKGLKYTGTIKEITSYLTTLTAIKVKFPDGDLETYGENELELITPKPFSKDDLRDGMKVTHREGMITTVFEDRLIFLSNSAIIVRFGLYKFKEDLTGSVRDLDIIQVKQGDVVLFEREEKKVVKIDTCFETKINDPESFSKDCVNLLKKYGIKGGTIVIKEVSKCNTN